MPLHTSAIKWSMLTRRASMSRQPRPTILTWSCEMWGSQDIFATSTAITVFYPTGNRATYTLHTTSGQSLEPVEGLVGKSVGHVLYILRLLLLCNRQTCFWRMPGQRLTPTVSKFCGSVPLSTNAGCESICVESPEGGAICDH